ncbi:MAG: DUF4412 domain-containing protein [Kiritimatiellae bacterium]|nr:DUF4412 domain-containing protein [Kiritimatiellia bacterium]
MHTNSWLSALAVITAIVSAAPATAQPQPGKKQQEMKQIWMRFEKELGLQSDYSADMEAQAMGMTIPAKIYRLKGKTRTDMTMPMMNIKMAVLELPENGKTVTYSVFPDQKKYCVDAAAQDGIQISKDTYRIEDAGTETHEGVNCKKRRLTVKDNEGTQVMDMLFSPAQKNMPVKMTANVTVQTGEGQPPQTVTSTVLFKNYNFSAPPERLFVIPQNYVKASSMQEVIMGNLFGGNPQQGSGMTLTPEMLKAVRDAQEQGAKEGEGNEAARQSLQNLRRLLGK